MARRATALMAGKLLILHDSPDFGGHERMLLSLLPGVFDADFDDVLFVMPDLNRRLAEQVRSAVPRIRIETWPFIKRRAEPYLGWLRWRYRGVFRALLVREKPDTVLLVQGRIENLIVPMLTVGRRSRLVSYLPMAHRLNEIGRAGGFGDRVRRQFYRRPDHFVVPSVAVAEQVRKAGGFSPITVADNAVQPPPRTPKVEARSELGIEPHRQVALFLGRLDTVQKGIDKLLGAMRRVEPSRLADWTFLFVGDGPSRPLVEAAAQRGDVDVRLIAWTDRPELYLSAADILLMPSRFEGLPLVMLEAMHYGLPVLASDIDVARLYLPADAVVAFATVDLPAKLEALTQPAAVARFARAAETKLSPLTLSSARRNFAAALAA